MRAGHAAALERGHSRTRTLFQLAPPPRGRSAWQGSHLNRQHLPRIGALPGKKQKFGSKTGFRSFPGKANASAASLKQTVPPSPGPKATLPMPLSSSSGRAATMSRANKIIVDSPSGGAFIEYGHTYGHTDAVGGRLDHRLAGAAFPQTGIERSCLGERDREDGSVQKHRCRSGRALSFI